MKYKSIEIIFIVTNKVPSLVKSAGKKEFTADLVTFTGDAHNEKVHFLRSDSGYWKDAA